MTILEFKNFVNTYFEVFNTWREQDESVKGDELMQAASWDFHRILHEAKKSGISDEKIKEIVNQGLKKQNEIS